MEIWTRRVRPFKPMNEAALDLYEAIGGEAIKDVEFMPIGELDCSTGIQNIIERLRLGYEETEISRKAMQNSPTVRSTAG